MKSPLPIILKGPFPKGCVTGNKREQMAKGSWSNRSIACLCYCCGYRLWAISSIHTSPLPVFSTLLWKLSSDWNRHTSFLSLWWPSSPKETGSSSALALAGNVCLWCWLSLVDCVPESVAHSSSFSRLNSLLFQFDFLITGNFPLKEISIYGHLLLMGFSSLFLSLFYVFKMK